MVKQDYAKPIPRLLDREREDKVIGWLGLCALAVLAAVMFWFGS